LDRAIAAFEEIAQLDDDHRQIEVWQEWAEAAEAWLSDIRCETRRATSCHHVAACIVRRSLASLSDIPIPGAQQAFAELFATSVAVRGAERHASAVQGCAGYAQVPYRLRLWAREHRLNQTQLIDGARRGLLPADLEEGEPERTDALVASMTGPAAFIEVRGEGISILDEIRPVPRDEQEPPVIDLENGWSCTRSGTRFLVAMRCESNDGAVVDAEADCVEDRSRIPGGYPPRAHVTLLHLVDRAFTLPREVTIYCPW
jgi:hypothetical protein